MQPKRDSAFDQKTRIVPSRETSGSSQNIYFSYNQRKKQSSARKDIFGTYSKSFGKLVFSFWWDRPLFFLESLYENHQNNCIQNKMTKTTFRKKSKVVLISIRYGKTIQTQDVKSQSTERSVRGKIAQPKLDSAFEQKTRIVSCREISASSQNSFFIYDQRIKPTTAQKDIFGTYSTSFWKVSVLLKKQKLFL